MRVYSVRMDRVSVSTAITILQIKAGANPLWLLRAWCAQSSLTTIAEQTIQINRKSGAATVTAFTPLKVGSDADAAALAVGGTAATGTNASAEGTDTDVLYPDSFNILDGWLWLPVEEERIFVPPAGIIGLKFPVAPSAMTVSAGLIFGEL